MRARFFAGFVTLASLASLGMGCPRASDGAADATSASVDAAIADSTQNKPFDASAPDALDAVSPSGSLLLPDEDVGPLLARLSESPGEFPSDNYVTNETSLLDVAPALRDPRLEGRAYVGVGPEQNFSYLAMLSPKVAYIVDIRRGNLLEHMFLRACFEEGKTRSEFLSALLARAPLPLGTPEREYKGFLGLAAAFQGAKGDPALRDGSLARVKKLLDRLHVAHTVADDEELARIHQAFFDKGLALAYTMKNSGRKYPTLAENFSAVDPSGAPATFLASEESYARVRKLVLENRVLPIVGDFGGKHALLAIADDMVARGLLLGAFYTSNVEQYLFDAHTYPNFIASVKAMPRDDASLLVRVWFDQGKPHPLQKPGQRTTQLTMSADDFVVRAEGKGFASYWDVVK